MNFKYLHNHIELLLDDFSEGRTPKNSTAIKLINLMNHELDRYMRITSPAVYEKDEKFEQE